MGSFPKEVKYVIKILEYPTSSVAQLTFTLKGMPRHVLGSFSYTLLET